MSKPSFTERTAIEIGIEGTAGTIRSGGLVQIPIYEAFNPLTPEGETQPLNRAKGTLDPDGVAIGPMSFGFAGQVYVFGSGISNLPPDWMTLIRACGFAETRTASITGPSDALTATSQAGGGSIAAGDYRYKFTLLYESNGTTPAATRALAAFESNLSSTSADETAVATDSILVAALPADGIKRVYRSKVGTTTPLYFVGEVADSDTTLLDTLIDTDIERLAPFDNSGPVDVIVATESATGGNMAIGTYNYQFTLLYGRDGAVITDDSSRAVYETQLGTQTGTDTTTGAGTSLITVTGLPSSGIKRLYRSTLAGGSDRAFVAEVASGSTSYIDTKADADLGDAFVTKVDEAIYRPVSNYDDFKSLTILSYLDSHKFPAIGSRGTMSFEGPASENMMSTVELRGVYNQGTKIANPATVANPGSPPQICGADLTITPESTGTAFTPVFKRIGIALGRTAAARRDGNASCTNAGLREFMISTRPDPRFTVSIEHDEDEDFIHAFRQAEMYAFDFHIGTTARKRVFFENNAAWGGKQYLAQLAAAPTFDTSDEGIRLMNLEFQLTGDGDNFLCVRHSV